MTLHFYIDKFGFDKSTLFKDLEGIIASGDLIAVVGENGVGKSTLVDLLSGNINSNIALSYEHTKITPGYNNYISYISSDFVGLEYLTAQEVAKYYTIIYGVQFDADKFYDLIKIANLKEEMAMNVVIKNLSKGTQQKVSFIVYMMINREVIIFDEGLENIDEGSLFNILQTLKSWTQEQNKICIIATHSKEVLNHIPKRVHLEKDAQETDISHVKIENHRT